MKARNENLLGRLQNLPLTTATVTGLIYLAVVGIADFYLPVGVRFTLLYVLGVAFIAWTRGPLMGLAGAVLASGVSTVIELTSGQPNYGIPILVWNESTRCLLFVATGWLIARAGAFARRLSGLVEERTAKLQAEAEQHKATADTLAETVERFEQVVNNITEVFWLAELPDFRVIYASPGYERVWGRACAEVCGDRAIWLATLHLDDRERISRRFSPEQSEGGYDVEYRITRPDGAVRWIRDRAFPVRNSQGEVYRIAGLAEDVTDRKRARETLETQAAILENMAEAAVMTDDQGNIVLTNATLDKRLGYERGELVGRALTVMAGVSAEEHERAFNAAVEAVKAHGYIAGEYRARRKDGSTVEVEARGSGVTINGRFGLVVVAQDITERKQAGEALRKAHATLELRVRERTVELEAANKALRESEARLRLALDASNAGTWSWDAATNTSDWDHRYHEMYGLDPHDPRSFEAWIARVHPEDRPGLLKRIQAVQELGAGERWNEEFRVLHPAKGERWMMGVGRVESSASGRAVRLSGINLDITERKQAEKALRSQLAYTQTIYQNAPVGLCVLDLELRYVQINEQLAAMNGFSVAQHLGRTMREVVPHLSEAIETVCRQVIATGQPVLDLEIDGATDAQPGVFRTWVSSWVPLKEADGRVSGISLLVEEVTERKRVLRALRESEEKYRRLHESMRDAFVSVDLGGRITEFNPAYQALLGYTADELRQLTYIDLTPEKWHAMEARIIAEQLLPQGYSEVYEKEYRRKDGTIFPVELRTFVIRDARGQPAWMWALVRDVSRRKQAEAELREARDTLEARVKERTAELEAANAALAESEERYRSLVTNLNVGVYRNTPDPDGRFLHGNPALARIHGFDSVEEFKTLTVFDTYQEPEDRKQYLAELLRRGSVANYEVRLKKKDGTPIYCSVNATVHRRPDGEVDWIDGVVEDITERKKAEEAQRASEVRYRTLAESSPDAIFILDRDIRLQYVNSKAAALFRRRPEDLVGFRQADLFQGETAQTQARIVQEVFATGDPFRREKPLAFPVGDQWIEIRLAPIYDAQGAVSSVMGICRDMTERKRAEQQLSEALDLNQKMIAASTMGIAAFKASGECVFANEALARILGGSLSEVRESNFRRLESWRDCGLLQLADEVLSQGQSRSNEGSRTTRFGKSISLDCHLAPFFSNGQPHLLYMALDISERKRAEEALKMQSLVLQNMAEGALLIGPDLTILFANSALESMFRYEQGELNGRQVSVLNAWPPEETACFNAAVMRATEAGGVWLGHYENRRKDGTLFTSESRVIRLTLGGQDHFISVQQDITERKRAESLLQAQRDLAMTFSVTSDLYEGLERLLEIAMRMGGLDSGSVYLLDEISGGLRIAVHQGVSPAFVKAVAYWPSDGPQMRLINQGRPIFSRYLDLPLPHDEVRLREGLRAIALVPLLHRGKAIGALALTSHENDEIPLPMQLTIEAVAAQATGAIARIRGEAERHRLERQLLEISDREHARIGQDLHDGLCQHLVSLALDANSLRGQLAAAHRPEAKTARRIADYLDQAITEARQLSRGLFPVRLAGEGLPPALEELAASTRDRFKIRCRFASEGHVAVESSVMATHLYRIAQEAVTNAVKHSGARSVAIRLRARSNVLELSITDDGMGLSAARQKAATGMGLQIMDYRARTIGGTLQVGRGHRRGTKVSCCVPTAASEESSI